MDIFEELRQLFDQVSIDKWYPLVQEHTFRTESLSLSKAETKALLRKNREVRNELGPADEETNQLVCQLTERLQLFLEQHFRTPQGVKAFIKLSDRSPKDATNLSQKIEKLYKEHVDDISNVGLKIKITQHQTDPNSFSFQTETYKLMCGQNVEP